MNLVYVQLLCCCQQIFPFSHVPHSPLQLFIILYHFLFGCTAVTSVLQYMAMRLLTFSDFFPSYTILLLYFFSNIYHVHVHKVESRRNDRIKISFIPKQRKRKKNRSFLLVLNENISSSE